MRIPVSCLVLTLAMGVALAQRHKPGEADASKPEGQLIQQIEKESDAAKKIPLAEQFLAKFPKHPATAWVLEILQPAYIETKNMDKVIEVGQKMAALDPDDYECALQTLKAVETKKNPDLVKKWAAATAAAVHKYMAAPGEKPEGGAEYAQQVETYADYAMFRAAVEAQDLKRRADLGEALLAQSPKGTYAGQVSAMLLAIYQQTGNHAKAVALAEKAIATDPDDEQMLVVVADSYARQKKDPQKAAAYAAKTLELLDKKARPETIPEADWAKRKTALAAAAHMVLGRLQFDQGKFAAADKEFRLALAGGARAELLFFLGMANYKMEKPQEAVNYFRQCNAMESPFKNDAGKNVVAIRTEYRGVK